MTDTYFVNRIFGGGVFVCRRPVATENGFCAYHGDSTALDDVELEFTWREWLKVQFIRRPKNAARRLRRFYGDLRLVWRLRHHPKCNIPECQEKAMNVSGGKCIDHYCEDLE